ncbi:gp169 [Synechococcus phage S-RIM8 A.HR3]|uniref:Gp169 n=1 Tax=Synechococcus phage S-RIM8 A.HR1 TaxID=869724 RepID=H6BIC0_9CAUD|nr:gp169 [Synechococcus phage S-RIM8 A.HR1]AFB17654.1 gp169 [Synechococcus phage S-RIM8 A.HR1]AFB17865.1 gp169 [Synechococcus phage S-RIM8 A.HR3]AGH57881.1 hypothetical protein CPJG_00129 [Synechococcus phage KBS-M-1A]
MTSKIKQILRHPVTHFNVLVVGFLFIIQSMHTHAHYTMSLDADSYVRNFCKKNIEKCKRIID